jgi:hypothetical protein
MSQRVTIQYSIDLEELSGELNRLLGKANAEIDKSLSLSDSAWIELELEDLHMIGKIRGALAKSDLILNDIQTILEGYLSYQQDAPTNPGAESLSIESLQDKIARFKEVISEDSHQEPVMDNKSE